jgi:phosphohistidine swiveling domain-containing protein
MPRHVLWLDEIEDEDHERVGAKAMSLARLRRAGLPVPEGFVLTASAEALTGERLQALADASDRLPHAVAVRSSSTAEDLATASFAGQYLTLLDLRGGAAIADAARRCLESSGDAVAYARSVGASDFGAMAVLVQRFVEPVVAGVVFTRDPRHADRMLVESHAGRGEALVSGRVTPDRYVLRRSDLSLLEGPGAGSLDGTTLAAVAELARRVEAICGSPQDVEWAVGEPGLVLLQARPISVENESPLDVRVRRLTRANVGEVLPGPLTPLTEATLVECLEHAFHEVTRRAGVRPDDASRFLVLYRRRLYLNLDLCIEVAARLPGVSPADAERLILGGGATRGSPGFGGRHGLGTLAVVARLLRLAAWLPPAVRESERAIDALPGALEIEAGGPAALARWLRDALAAGRRIATTHIAVSGSSAARLAVLGRVIDDGSPHVAARLNRLVAGLDGVESAGPALELEALALQARRTPEWAAWLAQPASAAAAMLAGGQAPPALAAELAAFRIRYGHRAVDEGELSASAWEDDAVPLVTALQGLSRAVRSADFARRARAELRALDEEALVARAGPLRAVLLRWALRGAQQGVRQREATKSLAVSLARHLRRLARSAGRWLVQEEAIADAEDVFFMTSEELRQALADGHAPIAAIARRRRRQEREAGLPAPRELDLADPDAAWQDGRPPLAGVGVSAGVGAGRARILVAGTEARVEPGEVIVTSVLDAGLGPLLAGAGGAVAEIGGLLSHGAVVARELGVPCVVDVRDATRLIRPGDHVLVDGDRGHVRIVSESETARAAVGDADVRPADVADEAFHPLAADRRARESVYLNVQDPSTGLALVASLGVRHGGRGEAVVALALPDGRLLFGLELGPARFGPGSVTVGRMRYDWHGPSLRFDGALAPHEIADFPPGPIPLLLAPRTARVRLELSCRPTTPAVDFCDGLPDETLTALRAVGSHHVEQSGVWKGSLDLEGRSRPVVGTGSRDHSWGLRDWNEVDHWRLFTVRLGDDFAVHALALGVRGARVEGGFLWRDGRLARVTRVEHVTERDAHGRVRAVQVELGTRDGGVLRLHGIPQRVIRVPLQLDRRPLRHLLGRPYGLALQEHYTLWEANGRRGHGMAEYAGRARVSLGA